VAVLTYLRRILESLEHPDMIHLILHYLLALPDSTPAPSGSRASISAARKRKSLDLATMMATHIEVDTTPALFNLVDLIQTSLKSESEQTVSTTLQLVSVILKRHHRYAVTTLLWTSQILSDGPQRTIGAHDQEMEFLLNLAGVVGGDDNFDDVYENHVKDSMSTLESHPCSIPLLAPKATGSTMKFPGSQATIPGAPRDIRSHTLRPEDPMLKTLNVILSTFFTNSLETNLSLTGAIVDLAACGFMRIDGWLLPDPSKYTYEEEEDEIEDPYLIASGDAIDIEERAQVKALRKMRRTPIWNTSRLPAFLAQLEALVDQIQEYRASIPRFDELLQQRREAFIAASSNDATPMPPRQQPDQSKESSRSTSPRMRSGFDTLAQRIFPELGTPSRSNSPRGRRSQDQQRSSNSGFPALTSGYGFNTPTNGRNPNAPPTSHPNSDTPSRDSSRAFSPSPLRGDQETLRGVDIPPSQTAAFAAVDQSILARKVSLPIPKSEVEPIPFPDLKAGATTIDGSGESVITEHELATVDVKIEHVKSAENPGAGEKEVTVSHILTNVLVLQEFILEIAALVQVRAGLFGEVRFV
jgi:hypothetical protein